MKPKTTQSKPTASDVTRITKGDLLAFYAQDYADNQRREGEYTLQEMAIKMNIPINTLRRRVMADVKAGRVRQRQAYVGSRQTYVYEIK
jgi:predicted transcriptional regulator